MKKKTASAKLIEDLSKEEKTRISLYVSKSVYKKFQKKCGKIPASQVVEKLMEDFIKG